MDKHIHIDSIRKNLGITLVAVSNYNSANRDEIENIETIFSLQGTNKEKVLALLYLLASGENNDVIQSYRNQTGLQETLYDSSSSSITKYNLMLVTAFIYVPTFYTTAINYYGAISIGLPVGVGEDKSIEKNIKKNDLLTFPKAVVKIAIPAAVAAIALLVLFINFQLPKSGGLTFHSDPGIPIAMSTLTPETIQDVDDLFSGSKLRGENSKTTDELNKKIVEYTNEFTANPKDYDMCKNLIFLYIQKGSWADVVEFSTKALDISKGDPLALLVRGLSYYEMGPKYYQNAMEDLQAVIKMSIQSKRAYFDMGWIYIKEKEYEKAIEAFEACRAIDPEFSDVNEIIKWLILFR